MVTVSGPITVRRITVGSMSGACVYGKLSALIWQTMIDLLTATVEQSFIRSQTIGPAPFKVTLVKGLSRQRNDGAITYMGLSWESAINNLRLSSTSGGYMELTWLKYN
ncbi:hypothetical protein AAC387_Pa10g1277 [Persea americana]